MTRLRQFVAFGLIGVTLSSCATILGGPITAYQRTKPLPGQPQREIRVAALVADIVLVGLLGTAVDFATGAIYRPRPSSQLAPAYVPATSTYVPAPGVPAPPATAPVAAPAPAAAPVASPTPDIR